MHSPRIHLLIGFALLSTFLFDGCSQGKDTASGRPSLPVETETLQTENLQDSTEYVGTLESEQTLNLVPQINGLLTKILVSSGAQVKKGQPLFIIAPDQTVPQYNSNLQNVQANIQAKNVAVANLASSMASLNSALQIVQVDRAQLKANKAQYELAKYQNNATQYLAQKKVATEDSAQQTESQEKVTYNNVIAAQKQLASALQQVEVSRGQVAAAQGNIAKANAEIKQAQELAASAQVSVGFKTVTAPTDGIVGNISLRVGSYVNPTSTILTTINQNNAFDLQIPVPLSKIAQLKKDLPVQLMDPNTGESLAEGNIYFVSPTTNTNSQVILTRAMFKNPNGKLRNFQYVKSRIVWKTQPGVLVPALAITTIGPQNFVFVPQEVTVDGKTQLVAKEIPVILGPMQGQNYQIVSGLKTGDKIIISNILRLTNGAPISLLTVPTTKSSLRLVHPLMFKV